MYYTRPLMYGVDWTFLLLIAAFVLSMVVQFRMQSTFAKYSQVRAANGMTGAQVAQMILQSEGLYNVQVQPVQGTLTDHYDPSKKVVCLSQAVYGQSSLAAQSVAAHECGHAIQDAQGYMPLRWRTQLVPVANFGSQFSWILLMLGLFMSSGILIRIGILLFALALLFQLVTLPVEIDASRRALMVIEETGMLAEGEELAGAKKVLRCAAMTYVASLAVTLANLLRFILIFTGGKRKR